jgi:hypothetical protein
LIVKKNKILALYDLYGTPLTIMDKQVTSISAFARYTTMEYNSTPGAVKQSNRSYVHCEYLNGDDWVKCLSGDERFISSKGIELKEKIARNKNE